MGSSLPDHDAKNQRTDTKEREKEQEKKTKGRLQVSTENIEITILYDA